MKKILNGIICCLFFGATINCADCYETKSSNNTQIKGRRGYDNSGRYDPSSAYSRKFSRSSNPKVADKKMQRTL